MSTKNHATNTKSTKRFDWAKIKSNIEHGFRTGFVTGKILGFIAGGAYLVGMGINQNNVVFMGLGAVIGAYAIIVLVSTAHSATDRTA